MYRCRLIVVGASCLSEIDPVPLNDGAIKCEGGFEQYYSTESVWRGRKSADRSWMLGRITLNASAPLLEAENAAQSDRGEPRGEPTRKLSVRSMPMIRFSTTLQSASAASNHRTAGSDA